jgi:long-chain fatty acid transport protein
MRLLFLIIVLTFHNWVLADEYHHKNLLLGTKAIGLGGAFTAISDDLSAVFYNPAGLTNTTESNSASISTFAWDKTNFKDVFSTGDDFTRSSFSIVPSFLGVGSNRGSWQWGLGFGVSDMDTERNYDSSTYPLINEQNITLGQQTEFANIDLDNTILELAFGVSRKVNDKLSIGGALNLKYKTFEAVQGSGVNAVIQTPDNALYSGFSASRRWKDENIVIAPMIGLLYQTENVDVGFTISKDIGVERSFKASHSIFVSSLTPLPPNTIPASTGTRTSNKKQKYSTKYTLGLAKRIKDFEWSVDLDYYAKESNKAQFIGDPIPPINRDYQAVTNHAIGLTFYQSQHRYFRFGIFTDNANDKIDESQPFQRTEVIDMLGFSVDYTTDSFEFPFSVGAYYKYGTGKVRVADIRAVENLVGLELYPKANDFDISSATKSVIVIFVSANFN